MRVKWLRQALRNLADEAEYLGRDNPAVAQDMVAALSASIELLSQQPALGRPGRLPGTRELVIQRYPFVVPYRVRNGVLEVLRIYHTARKPPMKW